MYLPFSFRNNLGGFFIAIFLSFSVNRGLKSVIDVIFCARC